MNKFLLKHISSIVFIIALILLIIHLFGWSNFQIDYTTILLLVILLISPFINQMKKIKFGEFEAEIEPIEVKKIKNKIDEEREEREVEVGKLSEEKIYAENLVDLYEIDSVLALAKLRMELESRLKQLHSKTISKKKTKRYFGLNRIIKDLAKAEVLPQELSELLKKVIHICNRAVHGENFRIEDGRIIVESGLYLLSELDFLIHEKFVKKIDTKEIPIEEAEKYLKAKYKVTTIVPTIPNSAQNIYILDQDGLDALLEGYEEYAEFLISIEKIEET